MLTRLNIGCGWEQGRRDVLRNETWAEGSYVMARLRRAYCFFRAKEFVSFKSTHWWLLLFDLKLFGGEGQRKWEKTVSAMLSGLFQGALQKLFFIAVGLEYIAWDGLTQDCLFV